MDLIKETRLCPSALSLSVSLARARLRSTCTYTDSCTRTHFNVSIIITSTQHMYSHRFTHIRIRLSSYSLTHAQSSFRSRSPIFYFRPSIFFLLSAQSSNQSPFFSTFPFSLQLINLDVLSYLNLLSLNWCLLVAGGPTVTLSH